MILNLNMSAFNASISVSKNSTYTTQIDQKIAVYNFDADIFIGADSFCTLKEYRRQKR